MSNSDHLTMLRPKFTIIFQLSFLTTGTTRFTRLLSFLYDIFIQKNRPVINTINIATFIINRKPWHLITLFLFHHSSQQ